jgi:hypothetical protein
VITAVVHSGCGSYYRQIPPRESVAMKKGDGLLVIDLASEIRVENLQLAAWVRVGPLDPTQRYHILSVPPGRYSWRTVEVSHYGYWYRLYRSPDGERREFDVVAGQINYPGQLQLRRAGPGMIHFGVSNQSAHALADLEQLVPDLLTRHPMVYTGFQRDDFLLEYRRTKEARDVRSVSEREATSGVLDP